MKWEWVYFPIGITIKEIYGGHCHQDQKCNKIKIETGRGETFVPVTTAKKKIYLIIERFSFTPSYVSMTKTGRDLFSKGQRW